MVVYFAFYITFKNNRTLAGECDISKIKMYANLFWLPFINVK